MSKENLGCLLLVFVDGSMCTFQVCFLHSERFPPKFLYYWKVKSVLIGICFITFVPMFSVIVTRWSLHEQCKLTLVWIIKWDVSSLYITTVWMQAFSGTQWKVLIEHLPAPAWNQYWLIYICLFANSFSISLVLVYKYIINYTMFALIKRWK